ncbi:hypothetical protein IFT84_17595 [Rhizobium sp. CFBP 8762]|uniref:hypothetical protein n=1 Tax=Rhizobium sp. CFBP 8762 TaxID=2775279 RepID=UPI001785B2A4|nr:hypothetical protein [Rhizobium sp. CFBP 8762]MBD8556325.1 hypothetical protein [Rhizobium sp. CFBP 8762]
MTTGHNSGDLTENEEKALFFHHTRKNMATKAKIKALQAEMKQDRKLAQADGIVLSRIDFAEKALAAEDKSTITQKVNDQLKIMEWLHIIPAYNEDLLADRAPREEKIEGQGEIAGLAAVDRVSTYAANSEDDRAWLRGYDRGQAIMRDNLEKALTKKQANRTNEEPEGDGSDPFPQDEE